MLAMDVNDNAGCLTPSGVCASIANMLAPTGAGPIQGNRLRTYSLALYVN